MHSTRPTRDLTPIALVERIPAPLLEPVTSAIVDAVCRRPAGAAPVAVPDDDWPGLWAQLRNHRIGALLGEAVKAEAVLVPESAVGELAAHRMEVAARRLRLVAAARSAVRALADEGIECRVLKGLATSALDHPVPGLRETSDVDLLVRSTDFAAACRLFRRAGHRETVPDLPAELVVESTFLTDTGIELDLHHRLFRFGTDTDRDSFADGVALDEIGANALFLEGRLVHAAGHLLLAPPGNRFMSSLVDTALLGANAAVDADRVDRFAARFGLAEIVGVARWVTDNLGAVEPEPCPEWSDTLIHRAYLRTSRSIPLEIMAFVQSCPGWSQRARYLRYQLGRPETRAYLTPRVGRRAPQV